MRICLSYGHDPNQEVVLLVKERLEKAGHDTWIDQERIKFTDDWRRTITDGIRQSDLVLVFLSRHSTRDPGVCLNEIAIALRIDPPKPVVPILVESEQQVAPPVALARFQWLDLSVWREYREGRHAATFQEWLSEKTDILLAALQQPNVAGFAGEVEDLAQSLQPLRCETRIARLIEGFQGRTWVFKEIDDWVQGNREQRVFVIEGVAGTGKSSIAARLNPSREDHCRRRTFLSARFP